MNIGMLVVGTYSMGICLTILLVVEVWQWFYIKKLKAIIESKVELETAAAQDLQTDSNSQLLPMSLFETLGLCDISKITLKDSKEMMATIMNANIPDFEKKVRFMNPQRVYDLINKVLSGCVPVVYEHGGEISQFHNAGFVATYTKDYENALCTAVSMCEYVGRQDLRVEGYEDFSIGLCYGTVMVGVVGHQRRMDLSILSAYTGLASYLQTIAGKYYARILVTGTYANLIEKFEVKFNYRFIGYLYIKSTNVIEKVYDVYDGDEVDIRNRKRKTRMVFEKGIKVFTERNYELARIYFIEVLKTDRYDMAAREYVLMCERNMAAQSGNEASVYIEVY